MLEEVSDPKQPQGTGGRCPLTGKDPACETFQGVRGTGTGKGAFWGGPSCFWVLQKDVSEDVSVRGLSAPGHHSPFRDLSNP